MPKGVRRITGAYSLFEDCQSDPSSARIPSSLRVVGVSPREAEQGVLAAKLRDATLGGARPYESSPRGSGRMPAVACQLRWEGPAPRFVRHGVAGAMPGVLSSAYFRLDKQTKVRPTAVREQRNDQLVSAESLMV